MPELAERARQYLSAIEDRATGERLSAFFDPAVVQEEFPNRLVPTGATRGLAELLEGAERGQAVLSSQRYDILNELTAGETVILEVLWRGTLKIPVGTLLPGDEMRARFAVFLEFRDGLITAQRNYDCFDPF